MEKRNIIEVDLGSIKNTCFVVMPFESTYDREYEKTIKPAVDDTGLECIRADQIYEKQRIVDDIWKSIRESRVIIAELTGRNPNVLYEVGLAHAIRKPVIIISRNRGDVPFDLGALRCFFYDTDDPNWGESLKKEIVTAIKNIIENPELGEYLEGISVMEVRSPGTYDVATSEEEDDRETEYKTVQSAVHAMMTDNEISILPNPVSLSTNDMGAFPDATTVAGSADKQTDVNGNSYTASDRDGFILYQHDRIADGDANVNLVNYVNTQFSRYYYDVDSRGTVTQYNEPGQ